MLRNSFLELKLFCNLFIVRSPLAMPQQLRLGMNAYPPYRYECAMKTSTLVPTDRCVYPGFEAEKIGAIMHNVGLKYTLYPINETLIKRLGFIRAVFSMIETAEIDTAVFLFDWNAERQRPPI